MTSPSRNAPYDDDDLKAKIDEIEALEAQKTTIMAKAAAECSAIAGKIKAAKKEAKDDLSIPLKVLNPLLRRRKLERKIQETDEAVDDDFAEIYQDAAGQFCFFSPAEQDETSNVGPN